MKVLVLTQTYPSNSNIYAMTYVHSRTKRYIKKGIDVDVLSFSAKSNYDFEKIRIYTEREIEELLLTRSYDIVVSHAPNIRNHMRFLLKNINRFKQMVFIIHGHEVLKKTKYCPDLFFGQKGVSLFIKKVIHDSYDYFKISILQAVINKYLCKKLRIIFVSQTMKDLFLKNIRINKHTLDLHSAIVHNPIGQKFIKKTYICSQKKRDVITIRPLKSRYSIDIIIKIAEQNPELIFDIYGKGDYFKYNHKPQNLIVHERFLKNNEIPKILNQYKIALMPSRRDSQGIMMCEMATFGIPLITSDTPAYREMLKGFDNVYCINNDKPRVNIKNILTKINTSPRINKSKFNMRNTVDREIQYLQALIVK